MARKNKSAKGKDQKGYEYEIKYQPDWLKRFKVSRKNKKGKKTTDVIFTNPETRQQQAPGTKVTTDVASDEGVNFSVTVNDPLGAIKRIRVEYATPATSRGKGNGRTKPEIIVYTMDDDLPPPTGPGGGG